MKKKDDIELKDVKLKKVYASPQLGLIKFFADQVLSTCMASFGSDCASGPCRTQGN